jgi:hypothetical protein
MLERCECRVRCGLLTASGHDDRSRAFLSDISVKHSRDVHVTAFAPGLHKALCGRAHSIASACVIISDLTDPERALERLSSVLSWGRWLRGFASMSLLSLRGHGTRVLYMLLTRCLAHLAAPLYLGRDWIMHLAALIHLAATALIHRSSVTLTRKSRRACMAKIVAGGWGRSRRFLWHSPVLSAYTFFLTSARFSL